MNMEINNTYNLYSTIVGNAMNIEESAKVKKFRMSSQGWDPGRNLQCTA